MALLNSITHSIPLTPQTDPNKFPRGDYQPYPRMMVQMSGKPFTDSSGRNPVIVQNEDEEEAFRAEHSGEVRDNIASAADTQDELVKLRAENQRLRDEAKEAGTSVSQLIKGEDVVVDEPPPSSKPAAQAASRRTPPRKLD